MLITDCKLIKVDSFKHESGDLSVFDFDSLPMTPKRIFSVYKVPEGFIRGNHAHHTCEQILICMKGELTVKLDDGFKTREVILVSPKKILYIPALIWCEIHFSVDSSLLVIANKKYHALDYIHDYDAFKRLKRGR